MADVGRIENLLNMYAKYGKSQKEDAAVKVLELLGYEVDYSLTYNEYRVKEPQQPQ